MESCKSNTRRIEGWLYHKKLNCSLEMNTSEMNKKHIISVFKNIFLPDHQNPAITSLHSLINDLF